MARAQAANVAVRGYIPVCLAAPTKAPSRRRRLLEVARALLAMGCYEVSLGDTIGTGTAGSTQRLLETLLAHIPARQLGPALPRHLPARPWANILVDCNTASATIDASVAGLAAAPMHAAPTGNVATEDVVYMLNGMGIDTGIDLDAAGQRRRTASRRHWDAATAHGRQTPCWRQRTDIHGGPFRA